MTASSSDWQPASVGELPPDAPPAGAPYRGRLRLSAEGELVEASPPLASLEAIGPHAKRIAHAARFAVASGDLVHTTLYHWVEGQLWTQEAHLLPRSGAAEVLLAAPLACLGNPTDEPLVELAMAHANDVILVTEAEPVDFPGPRVVYANPAFTRMTGYRIDEIIGKTPRILQGEASEPEAIARMGRALRAGEPTRVELTNYRKDGTPFVVEIDLRPITDATGWYTHWISVQRDVTAQRLLEARSLRLEQLEAVARLAGGVAHDFNNLLVGVVGNLELAKSLAEPGTELADLLDDAESAALQSKRLTRQLLRFSAESHPTEARLGPCDLGDLVRQTVQFATRGTAVEVRYDGVEAPTEVDGDPGLLSQVLTNVVLNAVEAMERRGTLAVRVFVGSPGPLPAELDPGREYAVVEIEDSGPGVALEEVGRIFEPYYTTELRGSGIGLAVAWTVLRWHRGLIEAERGREGGLIVRLFVPRARAPVARPEAKRPNPEATAAVRARLHGLTVLWMDDDDIVGAVAERFARRLGWRIEVVTRGEDVLSRFEAAEPPPDLLVLDRVIRHGMGGVETLHRVRGLGSRVPVLLASGYAPESNGVDLAALAPVARIAKPFSLEGLTDVVGQLLWPEGGESDP